MTKPVETPTPIGNLGLMLRTHLPRSVKDQRAKIAQLERSLQDARAELENLLAHAHVEKLQIDADEGKPETDPKSPEVSPPQQENA